MTFTVQIRAPPVQYQTPKGRRWEREKAAAAPGAFDFPDDPKRIGPWILGECVGKGASGRVKIARNRFTSQLAAVKILPLEPLLKSRASLAIQQAKSVKQRLGIDREITMMKLMEHPNIMRIYDVYEGTRELFLVLEYVEGGELFDFVVNRGRLRPLEALQYFKQIIYGLAYAHAFSIVHRDLKPENILIQSHNPPLVKIADWGMAAFAPPSMTLETSCGSPHYASPEIVNGKRYGGGATDIWSCGVILYVLLSGRLPFDDQDIKTLLSKVTLGEYEFPSSIDPLAKDLISRMLIVDAEKRLTIPQIFAHPWFAIDTPTILYVPAPSLEDLARPVSGLSAIVPEVLDSLRIVWGHHADLTTIARDLLSPPGQGIFAKAFYFLLSEHRARTLRATPEVGSREGWIVTKQYDGPCRTFMNRLQATSSLTKRREPAAGSATQKRVRDVPESRREFPFAHTHAYTSPPQNLVPPVMERGQSHSRSRSPAGPRPPNGSSGCSSYVHRNVTFVPNVGVPMNVDQLEPSSKHVEQAPNYPNVRCGTTPVSSLAGRGRSDDVSSIRFPISSRESPSHPTTNPAAWVVRPNTFKSPRPRRAAPPVLERRSTEPPPTAYFAPSTPAPTFSAPQSTYQAPTQPIYAPVPIIPSNYNRSPILGVLNAPHNSPLPMLTAPRTPNFALQRTIDDITDRVNSLVARDNGVRGREAPMRAPSPEQRWSWQIQDGPLDYAHINYDPPAERRRADKENERAEERRHGLGLDNFSGKANVGEASEKGRQEKKNRPATLDLNSSKVLSKRSTKALSVLGSPTVLSPTGTEFKGWFSNLFNWKAQTTQILYSFASLSDTRSETGRVLGSIGITVAFEEGMMKCRADDLGEGGSRLRFRVEFAESGVGRTRVLGGPAERCVMVLVQEKGGANAFRGVCQRLRNHWRLGTSLMSGDGLGAFMVEGV